MADDNNANKGNALAHRENRTERIERFQALQPGTYWRPVHLEALEGEIHTDHSVPAGGYQPPAIDPGVFDPGTVYLLKRIEYADGEPHTVQVLDHPSATNNRGGPGTYHIRLKPFLAAFEYAPDGEAVREREIAGVHTRIEEKRTEVDRIAADPSYVMGLLTDGADAGRQRIADAETLCADERRQPLRLVVNGQGRLYLYAGPRDDEREERVGEHVWVQRQTLTARKKKFSVENRSWRQMPAFDPAERVIAEWDEAAYWAAFGTLPYGYHDVAVAIEACRRGREWLTRTLTDGIDNAEWHKRLMDLDEGERRLSRDRQVFIPSITIPVGILRNEDERRRPVGLCTLHFDQLRLLHRIAGDEQRERLNRWIHTHYYWSDERIEELDNEGPLTVAFNVGRFTSAEIGRVRDGATPDAPEHYFRGHNVARERGDLRALLTGERYGEEKPKPGDERFFPVPTETDVARVARTHWPVGGLPAESAEALDKVLLDRDE